MKLKNKLSLGIFFLSLSMGALGMPGDCIDNEEVSGTDGRVVTGIYYNIKSKSSGYGLDGRNQDYNNPLIGHIRQDDHFLWELISVGGGHYNIKSKSSSYGLDGRNQDYNNPLIGHIRQDDYFSWKLVSVGGGHYNIKSKSSGYGLDGRNQDYNNPLIGHIRQDDYFLWSFIPQNYELKIVIENFEYGASKKIFDQNTLMKTAATAISVDNRENDQPFVVDDKAKHKVQSKASWSFNDSKETNFSNKLEVRVDASVSGIAKLGGMDISGHVQKTLIGVSKGS